MKADLKKGEIVARNASIATALLALTKGVVGFLSGSVILIADAIHSAADLVAIAASWFGLRIAQKKANEKFPYGYYKAENLATLIVSAFLFYAAYEIITESYSKLFVMSELGLPALALSVAAGSAIISYIIAIYEIKVGKEINSQSLIANGQESRLDVWSSAVVFIGLALAYFKIPYVEAIIGFAMGVLIAKIAFANGKLAVFSLMDASPDKTLEVKVRKTILDVKGVKDIKNIKLRQSGPFVFGEAHVDVSKNLDVKRAHDISDEIEEMIKEKHPNIEAFTLHIEPFKKSAQKILIPVKNKKGLDSEVIGHFGRADYFLIINLEKNKIKEYKFIENKFIKKKKLAGLSAAKEVIKEDLDAIILQRIGEISFHTLRDNLIELYFTKGKTAKQVINNLTHKKLKILKKPTHSSEK